MKRRRATIDRLPKVSPALLRHEMADRARNLAVQCELQLCDHDLAAKDPMARYLAKQVASTLLDLSQYLDGTLEDEESE
jgi:hypothetical protein